MSVHWVAAVAAASIASPALAEWRFVPSAAVTETYTSNANYAGQGAEQSDWVTTLSGGLQIDEVGPRARLNGSITLSELYYARHTQANSFAPNVNLTGNIEAIDKFLFVDAQAVVSQNYYSAFGAQPGSLVNGTANRYTSQTYSVSPYVQGRFGGSTVAYQLRDDNIWTITSQYGDTALLTVPNTSTYFNHLHGSIDAPPVPFGGSLVYDGMHYRPTGDNTSASGLENAYTLQHVNAILPYQVDPTLQVSLRGGYENDRFPLSSSKGPTYGTGVEWNPSERTHVGGFWEHRFFGSSYSAQISHRLPSTSFNASYSRGLNTYPQNALTIPAGANVVNFVDAAFATRIPDPAERALAVQQFMARTGLLATTSTPVNILSPSVLLQDSGTVGIVLIGARNSLAFNVFYLKSNAISGTGSVLPDAFQFGQNTVQTGGGVSFSHQLTALTSLNASATYSTTTSNSAQGALADQRSANTYLNLGLGTRLGPKTNASAGVNYSRFVPTDVVNANTSSSLNVFATFSHAF